MNPPTHRVTLQRTIPIRIEIVHPANYAAALAGYWAERDTLGTGEQGFLRHLALMCESGFIPDSVERFGIIARVENPGLKIR